MSLAAAFDKGVMARSRGLCALCAVSLGACAATFGVPALLPVIAPGLPWAGVTLTEAVLAAGLCLLAAGAVFLAMPGRDVVRPAPLIALFSLLCVLAMLNTFFGTVPLQKYGDFWALTHYVEADYVHPRWFLGSALLTRVYQSVWISLGNVIGSAVFNSELYIRAAGCIVMTACAVWILRKARRRPALLFLVTTPVFLMFSTAYNEYYPFIAWVFVASLLLLEANPTHRHFLAIGAITALISLSYAAFVPLGIILLVAYAARAGWKKSLLAAGTACIAAVLLVLILYPRPPGSFARQYIASLHLGETYNNYPAYAGRSWGGYSPFFSPSFVVSFTHLSHLGFMALFGLGPVLSVLTIGTTVLYIRARGFAEFFHRIRRHAALAALLVFQLLYFLLLIPKLGPFMDVDLFFSVYLSAAYCCGLMLDPVLAAYATKGWTMRRYILSAAFSSGIVCCVLLLRPGGLLLPGIMP